jgi:uncharacterized protein
MAKLLSWVVLFALGYLVYRFIQISQRKQQAARDARGEKVEPAAKPGNELMLRCDQCGIHIPASEAVTAAGKHYCSIAHRDVDRAAGGGGNDEHSG